MSAPIWTVTTIGIHSDHQNGPRTWGYFLSYAEAVEGMHTSCDTEAGYYTHAVIEVFDPGIYAVAAQEVWFAWDEAARDWVSCDKPASEQGIINYGMG